MIIGILGIRYKGRMMQRFLLCGELPVPGFAALGERGLGGCDAVLRFLKLSA
jgi:hypothetical protein